ncbi:MAG: recombinase family protein, partial [Alphaproteobacteria bacterium]|nr:recombinase family protein [Alphaproteobacteria bacterium]
MSARGLRPTSRASADSLRSIRVPADGNPMLNRCAGRVSCAVAAEQRGSKTKKKLEIDPLHADTVRLIYRLNLEGDGNSGAMGVKNIAAYLNRHRIFTRDGGRWGIGQVHRILTRTTYIGRHEFNKRSKTKALKPVSEVVGVDVPPLIEKTIFDTVQARLKLRNPKVTPARVTSGPTLLTGICFCGNCGGAMTL